MTKLSLIDWLSERQANCMRISSGKIGDEREGWLDDAAYFASAVAALSGAAQPLAWGLQDARTGKLDHRLFQRQEAAVAAAERETNHWREVHAVPLTIAVTACRQGDTT